jgi:hypothetical protein
MKDLRCPYESVIGFLKIPEQLAWIVNVGHGAWVSKRTQDGRARQKKRKEKDQTTPNNERNPNPRKLPFQSGFSPHEIDLSDQGNDRKDHDCRKEY